MTFPYQPNDSGQHIGFEGVLVGVASANNGIPVLQVSTVNQISVTAISANQSLSAVLLGGTDFVGDVSALSPDAGLFRVSSIGGSGGLSANQSISAVLLGGTSNIGDVSAIVANSLSATADNFRVSAFNQDANFMHVSGFSPDAGLFRVSGILAAGLSSAGAANFVVSAVVDNGSISARSGDANQVHVSAIQNDATVLRVSADLYPDTVGGLTVTSLSSLSSSQNVKSTAGALYGYYLYNTDTIPQYINFTNTSGAINVGTDAVIFQAMVPASAAANVEFIHGMVGFTNGIGVYSVSAQAKNATTASRASATAGSFLYK